MSFFKIRKKYLIHILIIGLFIIYLSSANYIFNNIIVIEGESRKKNIKTSDAGSHITYNVEFMNEYIIKWKNIAHIRGWAFVNGQSANGNHVYLILESENKKYAYNTFTNTRPSVTKVYGVGNNLDLDNSGFYANIPIDAIKDDVYRINLYVKNNNGSYYTLGRDYLTKRNGMIYLGYVSKNNDFLQNHILECKANNIQAHLDSVKEKDDDMIEVFGWGYIEGVSADNNKTYVVFMSENKEKIYIFDTMLQTRKDVTEFFKNSGLNLDNSGFIANIQKNEIESGKYQIGIYIENGDKKALVYTDKTYEK